MANMLLTPCLKELAKRWLVLIASIYLARCTLLYFIQNRLAFPGSIKQRDLQTRIHFTTDAEKLHLTTRNGINITALFGSAAHVGRPTILYFYGNGGCAAWSQNEYDRFRELDCNVLIPDLAGYGESQGKANETNFYATADAAWNYLQTRPGIDGAKIIVVGWSMGAAVAVDLASHKPVAGLAIFNAYTTLPAMARGLFPWAPTGILLKYRFDNEAKISTVRCPTLVCTGMLDQVVSPRMSERLAAVCRGSCDTPYDSHIGSRFNLYRRA